MFGLTILGVIVVGFSIYAYREVKIYQREGSEELKSRCQRIRIELANDPLEMHRELAAVYSMGGFSQHAKYHYEKANELLGSMNVNQLSEVAIRDAKRLNLGKDFDKYDSVAVEKLRSGNNIYLCYANGTVEYAFDD